MRTTLLPFMLLLTIPVFVSAQLPDPVKWSFKSKKINDKTWEVHLSATIQAGWRLYAQETGEGPVPTRFQFAANPLVATNGNVKENGKLTKALDRNFDAELKYYEKQVSFVQTVTVKSKTTTKIKGSVEYMVASDREAMPPKKVDFAITVGGR